MKFGEAVQAQQALKIGSVLILIYIIANPELMPLPIRPYVAHAHSLVGACFSAIFLGWWPFVAGKVFLLAAGIFTIGQLMRVRKEKKEEKLEEKQTERMRRVREEAQRKLEELAAQQQRQEAERLAQEAKDQAEDRTVQRSVLDEEHSRKEEGAAAAREQSQSKLQAAMDSHQMIAKPTPDLTDTLDNSGIASGQRESPEQRSESKQRWVDRIQQQADAAAAQAASLNSSDVPDAVASASGAADPPTKRMHHSASSSSLTRGRTNGSAGSIIPLAVAQEAQERQQQWIQQLNDQLDAPEIARRAALESERLIRQEQDMEYQLALEADMKRQKDIEAMRIAAEEEKAARKRAQEDALAIEEALKQNREVLRASLAPEPSEDGDGAVVVRVRLPGGASKQRRFAADARVADISHWVSILEEMPLSAERQWRLVTSFPRTVPEESCSVQELAAGAAAVALFVEAS